MADTSIGIVTTAVTIRPRVMGEIEIARRVSEWQLVRYYPKDPITDDGVLAARDGHAFASNRRQALRLYARKRH